MSFSWQLPTSWGVKLDPATSWPFYIDHKHKMTTWQDPRFKRFILHSRYLPLKVETRKNISQYLQDNDDVFTIISVMNDIDTYFERLITDPDKMMCDSIRSEVEEYCTNKLLQLDSLNLSTNDQSRQMRKKTVNYIQSLSSAADSIL